MKFNKTIACLTFLDEDFILFINENKEVIIVEWSS